MGVVTGCERGWGWADSRWCMGGRDKGGGRGAKGVRDGGCGGRNRG